MAHLNREMGHQRASATLVGSWCLWPVLPCDVSDRGAGTSVWIAASSRCTFVSNCHSFTGQLDHDFRIVGLLPQFNISRRPRQRFAARIIVLGKLSVEVCQHLWDHGWSRPGEFPCPAIRFVSASLVSRCDVRQNESRCRTCSPKL